MTIQLLKHRFNVEEHHRMGEAGIFSEDARVEVIEGEILEMTPTVSRHAVFDGVDAVFSLAAKKCLPNSLRDPGFE